MQDFLKCAIVQAGRIWACVSTSQDRELHVEFGPHTIELRPNDNVPERQIPFVAAFLPSSERLNLNNGGGILWGINRYDVWRLHDGNTVHIQFVDRRSQEIEIGAAVEVKPTDSSLQFTAMIACHRAIARLELRGESQGETYDVISAVEFDQGCFGGTSRKGYQHVAFDLPSFSRKKQISLHVVYEGCTASAEDPDPFVFVANAAIHPRKASADILDPLIVSGRARGKSRWYSAVLPNAGGKSACRLSLVSHDTRLVLIDHEASAISLEDEFGHTLIVHSEKYLDVSLFCDDRPVQRQTLQAGSTTLRVPALFLTGEAVRLQLRDPSGTMVLFDTYVIAPRIITPVDAMQRENVRSIPPHLSVQSEGRYKAVRSHLADERSHSIIPQLPFLIEALERGYDGVKPGPIQFPRHDAPEVSVIVPCHNKFPVTFSCLCSLLLAYNRTTFEVILVDDGSSDDTVDIEKWVTGITIVRHSEPERFIRACNAGVTRARGRFIALLNNDTEPTVGWLDELTAMFDRQPRTGLVGSKLLFPDGKLQDAGGIIWGTGTPWQYGSRKNPWDPRFCYARQADYLPGAALMTTRSIWDEVGGLSSYLEPMYYEDTDLAFKIREAGYQTWFVPSSIVYHNEGTTSGTDTSKGFKKYQAVNEPKFKRRWAHSFKNHGREGVNPDLEKDRGVLGRVLFIDYDTPRPDRDAGGYAAIQEMKLVQSMGYKVTFLPENLAHFGSATDELQKMGVEVIYAPFFLSVDEFLTARADEFDAFYITRYHVAQNILPKLRETSSTAKVILNNADLHFLRELRMAISAGDPAALEQACRTRDAEIDVMKKVDLVLSYNETEKAVVESHAQAPILLRTCPWVVEVQSHVPPFAEREDISFLGGFRHPPNLEGLEWFLNSVMPTIAAIPNGPNLAVYGSQMTSKIEDRLKRERVRPVGYVEDARMAYDPHRVFIAPLLSGAGIKGKVLAALASGTPCVLSPVAAEGIGLRSGLECIIAEKESEWIDAIMSVYEDEGRWLAISQAGQKFVRSEYSFKAGILKMRSAFEEVGLFGSVSDD